MLRSSSSECRAAVIWIDWYAYHVARFIGLQSAPGLSGRVHGIEMVGGVGVHAGLKFKQPIPADLPVETLMPEGNWHEANKWQLTLKLWSRLSAIKPEVVLVPGYYTVPAISAALWARTHGRTSVLMTESASYDHVRVEWKEALKRITLKVLFDWAVAGGRDHVSYLRQLDFSESRIARFYDVVDNEMYSEASVELRASSSPEAHAFPRNYFLYTGRLATEKNVRGLLAAWMIYRFKGGTWSLVLAGDGPEVSSLRSIASISPFGKDVHFTGLKTTQELLPYYAFASCFVLASTREPWGLVVNEAMASGVPVLVSNRCGCAADLVLEGETGWVFDPADERGLAARMQQMEDAPVEQRRAMGERASAHVRLYSPQQFGREIAAIANGSASQHGYSEATERNS